MSFLKRKALPFLMAFVIGSIFAPAASAKTPLFSFSIDQKQFIDVEAGDEFQGKISVSAIDNEEMYLKVSLKNSAGHLLSESAKGSDSDVATWITIEGEDIEGVAMNEVGGATVFVDGTKTDGQDYVYIPYTVKIPEGVAPGDYQAAMLAKVVTLSKLDGTDVGASMSAAIANKLNISVAGERIHSLSFNELEHVGYGLGETGVEDESIWLMSLDYNSEGNAVLLPEAHVVVEDYFGKKIFESDFTLTQIFPGTDGSSEIELTGFEMPYLAGTVTVDLNYKLYSLLDGAGEEVFEGETKVVKVSTNGMIIVWAVGVLILLIVLFVLFKLFAGGKKGKCKMYVVKQGDTVQSVSAKFSVNSGELVKINKLSPPHVLAPGSKILIPVK